MERVCLCLKCRAAFSIKPYRTGGGFFKDAYGVNAEEWAESAKVCPVCGGEIVSPREVFDEIKEARPPSRKKRKKK